MSQRHANNWTFIGRLRSGATLEQAQAPIDALNAANLKRFPMFTPLIGTSAHSIAVPLQDDLVRDVRRPLYLLWAGAACVLLIGCVNVAAIRAALGASRARLMVDALGRTSVTWRGQPRRAPSARTG